MERQPTLLSLSLSLCTSIPLSLYVSVKAEKGFEKTFTTDGHRKKKKNTKFVGIRHLQTEGGMKTASISAGST